MLGHKAATILLSLLLATTTYAVDEVSPIDFCKDMSIIAKEIMTARQMDKPMSETLPVALDRIRDLMESYGIELDSASMEEMNEVFAPLVMAAYDRPVWSIESMQRDEISTFENSVFGDCYKGMTSDSEE